jgi:membrane protease YdiL (CAAX protease family)
MFVSEKQIQRRKVDKRTVYAIGICLFISVCLKVVWLTEVPKISWIQPLLPYRKLILSLLLIGPVVCFVEKASLKTLGFTIGNWKRTLITTVILLISVFLILPIILFWKHMGQLRVEGDMINFIGNRFSYANITPAIFYTLLIEQILEVALPEEIIFRGYFQSRLNYTWGPAISILCSSLYFAIVHFDRPLMLVHLLVIGPLYGIAFHYSKSIYPSVIAHYFTNIGGLLLLKYIAFH